ALAANAATGRGAGVYNQGSLAVTNSTFSANSITGTAAGQGGAIYNSGTLMISSSTFSGNSVTATADSEGGAVFNAGILTNGSSSGGTGFVASDKRDVNPLLGALRDNGGPTPTIALLPGSPAIDAGDNTGAPDFDQRGSGFPRIVNGTIDIGAFEAQATALDS